MPQIAEVLTIIMDNNTEFKSASKNMKNKLATHTHTFKNDTIDILVFSFLLRFLQQQQQKYYLLVFFGEN